MKKQQKPKIVVSEDFKKRLESLGKKVDTYEDIIKKFIFRVKVTKSDGKISQGYFRKFMMVEEFPYMTIEMPEQNKSEAIPFKIIKKIEEIK